MSTYYIYRIINIINNHDYIGKKKQCKSLEPLNDNYWGSGTLIKKAIQVYGNQNFRKEILETGLTFEEASDREAFWIQFFRNEGKAYYNISPGYEGIELKEKRLLREQDLLRLNNYKSEKTRENWANLSELEYKERSFHMSEAWKNKSEDEKKLFKQQRSEIQKRVYSQYSEEKKQEINRKRTNSLKRMHQERSFEQQAEINSKISQSLLEYNKNLSKEQKQVISEKLSASRLTFLKKETPEQRELRSKNQSLAQGKTYKLLDPEGNEFTVKALAFWCRQIFGDKGNSANVSFRRRGKYQGYIFLGECSDNL